MTLPPNRGNIATEQPHNATSMLDTLSTLACVELLGTDHLRAIEAVQKVSPAIATFIDALHQRVVSGGRLIYIGCGTSGRLGVLDAAECPPTFQSAPELIIGLIAGGDKALRFSSEAAEDNPNGVAPEFNRLKVSEKDCVLGITAGGTTPWVLGGLDLARACGALTCLLTCAIDSSACDHTIMLDTGPEPLTGSTRLKAGTATKLALNIIATTLFIKLGKVYGNMMVDLKVTNDKLRDRAIRIVSTVCELEREKAMHLLDQAEGNVKIAIIMQTCLIDATTAQRKLEDAGGVLRSAL